MTDRGHESPMDFQWEGSGPGDPNSPFRMSTARSVFTNDNQARKSEFPPVSPTLGDSLVLTAIAVKGNIFQSSPIKAPALSPPASQSFVFSTPYNQAPHTPHSVRPPPPQPIFRTPSFTTPRYSFNTPSRDSDIFSEGSPCTPDVDSESPTPGAPWTGRSGVGGAGTKAAALTSATPSRMPALASATPSRIPGPPALTSTTPSRMNGRGELRRGMFRDGSVTKARRRRQPQFTSRDLSMSGIGIFEGEEDEEEVEEEGNHPYSDAEDFSGPTDRRSWHRTAKSAATDWVAAHRELPLIASHYIQVFFNLSIILLVLYAIFGFYLTIRRDVDQKVEEYSESILAEMSLCSSSYTRNRCGPDTRVPAIEVQCSKWEKCMNRDPTQVGRARVSAETFAEIINSFIEPISFKTMFFVLLLIFGGLFISNTAFGFFRAKTPPHPTPYMSAPYMPAPPPTPSHWECQAQQQLHYESLPRSPAPSTPARMVGYGGSSRTPGWMTGRESVRGKEVMWR